MTMARIATLPLIGLIRLYQATLAYFFRGACRFEPSCSRYAIDALAGHGPLRGLALAGHRFCRCHPWGGSGYDPVPPATHAGRLPTTPPSARPADF